MVRAVYGRFSCRVKSRIPEEVCRVFRHSPCSATNLPHSPLIRVARMPDWVVTPYQTIEALLHRPVEEPNILRNTWIPGVHPAGIFLKETHPKCLHLGFYSQRSSPMRWFPNLENSIMEAEFQIP